MRSIAGLVVLAASMFGGELQAAEPPSGEHITGFIEAFEEAWKAHDLDGIKRLIALEGVPEGTVDYTGGYWEELLKLSSSKPSEWGGAKFEPLSEALAETPYKNVAVLRKSAEDQVINGRKYVRSVPVSGFMTLYIWGKSSLAAPVGIDHDGRLKIAIAKPASGNRTDDPLAAPIAPNGFTEVKATPEAIARFQKALEKALKTDKWEEVFSTEHVPLDVFDKQTEEMQTMLDASRYQLTGVELISVTEMFSEGDGTPKPYKKESFLPRKMNGRWYGFNLPVVGLCRVSMKRVKSDSGGTAHLSFPVGLTPAGELKKPCLVPVQGSGE